MDRTLEISASGPTGTRLVLDGELMFKPGTASGPPRLQIAAPSDTYTITGGGTINARRSDGAAACIIERTGADPTQIVNVQYVTIVGSVTWQVPCSLFYCTMLVDRADDEMYITRRFGIGALSKLQVSAGRMQLYSSCSTTFSGRTLEFVLSGGRLVFGPTGSFAPDVYENHATKLTMTGGVLDIDQTVNMKGGATISGGKIEIAPDKVLCLENVPPY
ncbi:hypothetical protein RAS1_04010 [Phycisphaerae bacterium RAS1]|nr:hypothetical protein RAS1_04010 [Phycisphaerae bacterium RAS1]